MHAFRSAVRCFLRGTGFDGVSRRAGAFILLLGLLVSWAAPAAGQPAFPGAPSEPTVNLRIYPFDLWSPRVGLGVGAGLVFHHFGRSNAQALLTFAPAQHEQVATGAWASANPRRARRYVLVNARGLHTNRDWFYGLGPGSTLDARQSIARSAVQVRVRVGQAFLDHRLIIQPHLGVSTHRIDRVPNPTASSLGRPSRTHLRQLASSTLGPLSPQQSGLRAGVAVLYDSRSHPSRSTGGVLLQGRWSRYLDLTSSVVRFDQFDLGAYGFLPLGGSHHLAGRLHLTLTSPRGRAAVPYYLRPTLGGSRVPGWARTRFVALDRFLTSMLYRFPILQILGVVDFDGHVGVHAASVYDAFFSEARAKLTFEESLSSGRASVPLRPSASAGLHVGLSFRETPSLDFALGLSPEGVTAVRFTFSQNLRALRPPHHRTPRSY